ncbi:MAG: hypothetical protein C4309_00650 [Chloroflexota bacterium]
MGEQATGRGKAGRDSGLAACGPPGQQRYFPYGQVRYTWGSLPTTYTFTGQRLDGTGLLYYGARYYAPP